MNHTFIILGFTPDVKVWEVMFDKSRNFKSTKRAYDLKGHKAGLLSIAFSADSSRIVSLSKDSTWKLWKTNGIIFGVMINLSNKKYACE